MVKLALVPLLLLLACVALLARAALERPPLGPEARRSTPKSGLTYVYWRNATKRTAGSVVPRPKSTRFQANELDYLEVRPKELSFVNSLEGRKCPPLELALERYTKHYLFDDVGPQARDDPQRGARRRLGQLRAIHISGPSDFACQLLPTADMDESYNLTVLLADNQSHRAQLNAKTSWGLLRALETLSQLIFNIGPDQLEDPRSGEPLEEAGSFAIQIVDIVDEPRFKHRGFMLDTARHYIPLATILELLDAMSFNKLNVFHWHLIDDQSFPLVSDAYPQLARRGAFRPNLVYTHEDVKLVILYAALRGIRVLPELDSPGHSYSMRHIPNFLSECYDPATNLKNGDFGPIDPTRRSSYKIVDRLLHEFDALFPDGQFFAGGDEVDFDCWKSSPTINAWLEAKNMTANYTELSNHYMRRLYKIIKAHRKRMIVWQEVFDMGANLPRDVIVSVWKYIDDRPAYMAQLASVVDQGYQAILSSCWYLNYIDYGQDWIKFYNCDPRSEPIKAQHEHLVLGGEICMWTEFVDHTNVVARTWPRASAAAERLWSPKEANNTQEFLHRLEQHRCRLLSRGIHAEPVNGPGYC